MINEFDCIVIGGGWGGLTFALLYAMTGKKTALFECHDRLGGYGHCFEKNGYQFCTNMHYFFDTQPGGIVHQFLKRIDLENQIQFTYLNKNNFDVIKIDDYNFGIPSNLEMYRNKLIKEFPQHTHSIQYLFKIRKDIAKIANLYSTNKKLFFLNLFLHPLQFYNFIKSIFKTSSRFLDKINIHHTLRTIILSRMGNFGILSKDLPLISLLLEMTYYTECATFPTAGMGNFINKIQEKLIEYNVTLYLNTEIIKLNIDKNKILSVLDQYGNTYTGKLYISDIDPKQTLKLCHCPISKKYNYRYTYSCFSLYLGLKNINLEEHGLGNFNTWYYPTNEIDLDCDAVLKYLDYKRSFLFISIPSAHIKAGLIAPIGSHTIQIVAPASYEAIVNLYHSSPEKYELFNSKIKEYILTTLNNKFIRNIRNYIDFSEFWSPLDLEKNVKAPFGSIYGMRPDKRKIFRPIGQHSPFKNLYFVGATATHPGLALVIGGAMNLYDKIHKLHF